VTEEAAICRTCCEQFHECAPLTIREGTLGLLTTLELTCDHCSLLGYDDGRGWKSHTYVIEAKKIMKMKSKVHVSTTLA
jgi:hypothetical protein